MNCLRTCAWGALPGAMAAPGMAGAADGRGEALRGVGESAEGGRGCGGGEGDVDRHTRLS